MRYAIVASMADQSDRLAVALRQTYEDAKVSQAAIATALGVEQPTVSKWAKGQNRPPLEALGVVERLAGVPLGTILRRAGFVSEATDFQSALAADPRLTDKSKSAIGLLYDVLTTQDAGASSPADAAQVAG